MTAHELEQSYHVKKEIFHAYIDSIKQKAPWDIYTITNITLIKNPFTSTFPIRFFSNPKVKKYKFLSFLKNTTFFYLRNFYLLTTYLIAFFLYKLYYQKQRKNSLHVIIDIFGLVDKTNKENIFNETYFDGIYSIFDQYDQKYCLLIRPYEVGKNPFKLIKFFKIINHDKRDFIFEYELLTFYSFVKILGLILNYPFKTLRLMQKEKSDEDSLFNQALLDDIRGFSIEPFTRYIFGEKLASTPSLKTIYSWSEFQLIERSFNFAIRKNNPNIKLISCQFYLNYETYFNAYVDDLDYNMLSSPHTVLVNGNHYILHRKNVQYETGISLRYKELFNFGGIKNEKNIIVLGSYIESDTKHMLNSIQDFSNIIFKNHPAVNIKRLYPLPENVTVSNKPIYELFTHTGIVIGTASGTSVEAVACGVSVIIISSQDNLTANPLVEYGRGEIWNIAFSKDDVATLYNNLLRFRKENRSRIQEIAAWYKDNFFIEPTEGNILQAFELNRE